MPNTEGNLHTSPQVDADRTHSPKQLTWGLPINVWWSFVWRSSIYRAVGGSVPGAIAGAIAGASGHLDKARVAGSIAGYVAGIAVSVPAFKQAP